MFNLKNTVMVNLELNMENVTLLHSQMNGTLLTGRKGLRDRMLKKCGTHSLISIIKV